MSTQAEAFPADSDEADATIDRADGHLPDDAHLDSYLIKSLVPATEILRVFALPPDDQE